ncbi:MAG: 23S rRNA (uracil(1939)-C(5))-methyltransferase RlmD [Bacteroidota bacterium]
MIKGDEVELQIESITGEGKTIARKEGMVYFVEHAVPGDTVRARLWKIKKNYCEARALEVVKPSPLRVNAKCKHFGVCGGCKWQDLSYEAQLNFKRQNVIDAFTRIGGFSEVDVKSVIGCDEPYFYRNKMEFTFSRRQWLTKEELNTTIDDQDGVALGLHVPQRYEKVLNLDECWLQSEISSAILNTVREIARVWKLSVYSTKTHEGYMRHLVIRDSKRTGELMVNLVTTTDWEEAMENITKLLLKQFPQITTIVNNITDRKSMVAFGDSQKIYHGPGYITDKIGDFTFHISANSFFQTNTCQGEKLYGVAKEFAGSKPTDVIYDLYSGTGTIAIFVSGSAELVIGIESVESATTDAAKNAEFNGISNCHFLLGDLKDRLMKDNDWLNDHPSPDIVIADPPRSGMHPKVIEQVVKLSPRRLVYVSCNPGTQARDVKLFSDAGYALKVVQPVDMFPHTDHIEAVALMEK